jgi:hypothetical protein
MINPVYYYESENIFIDERGDTIYNIYSIVDPNLVYLFKNKKEDMIVYGVHGQKVEMLYEQSYEYLYGELDIRIDRIERSFRNE